MAPGDEERPDRPEYNVYRAGSGRGRGGSRAKKPERKASGGDSGSPRGRSSGKPEYSVYRSSRNPLSRLREGGVAEGLKRVGAGRRKERRAEVDAEQRRRLGGERPTWRRVLKWALIGAGVWLLLSAVLFAVSAQIQKGKLDGEAADRLGAFPLLVASPQTILVIGTDARPQASGANEAETRRKCINQGARGSAPSADCSGFRADTLMLIRAGGGSFEKLSIPRDTLAEIPGAGPQKINSAYVSGGAALQIETVEDFLGIEVDHVMLLDFEGFADFIDAIGGVEVDVRNRLKAKIDGGSGQGGITLKLERGEHELDGDRALAYARARNNLWDPSESDLVRAQRQQEVLAAIKGRLTSPWRAPINFIRGPWIAWNAPKAMVTDMGALTLPQLAMALAIGGESKTTILGRNAEATAAGNLVIPQEDCRKALRRLLGEPPDEDPPCSPAATAVAPVTEAALPDQLGTEPIAP